MIDEEYHIPESDNHVSHDTLDASFASVESNEMIFQRIKTMENTIFAHRDEYLRLHAPQKKSWLKANVVSLPSAMGGHHTETVRSVIDAESTYGGMVFGADNKFWLDVKAPYSDGYQQEVADWYHVQQNPYDTTTPIVLHFQTTPQSVHKLYNAREYPMSPQETQVLFTAMQRYHDIIVPYYQSRGVKSPHTT